jgi:ribose-phosphate pyrophosphokinase
MTYTREKYPDGGIYAKVTSFLNPVIVERINTYEDLFFIKSLKDACDYNRIKDVELIIPCMFQQQHDRRFNENESFEVKNVADFINSCNFSRVKIFHPHSDVGPGLVNNSQVISNAGFISDVLADIAKVTDQPPILLSTDGGSFKWVHKLADKIDFKGDVYGASKARDAVTHKLVQQIDRHDFEGRDILICDDLCVFGGTFVGLAEMLKTRNVGKIYLAVSHITVPNPNALLDEAYSRIYTTDSKYETYSLTNLTIFKYKKYVFF